jgi:hypothetical protein
MPRSRRPIGSPCHVLNRRTGQVRRVYVDSETGKPEDREDQVKDHGTETGRMVLVHDVAVIIDRIALDDQLALNRGVEPISKSRRRRFALVSSIRAACI